jgi:hypothetical protein
MHDIKKNLRATAPDDTDARLSNAKRVVVFVEDLKLIWINLDSELESRHFRRKAGLTG